jgi:molybdopterin-biosynthesis enzyme MoeA-like protein
MIVETIEATGVPEGAYAAALGQVALAHPRLSIGSYPSFANGRFQNQIVVRGRDPDVVSKAKADIESFLEVMRAQ